MKKTKGSLGRGLSVILGDSSSNISTNTRGDDYVITGSTQEILISEIQTNPFQPRAKFNQEKLHELSISIKQLGIIQPITVRKLGDNKYQLISGERRLRASKIAG